MTNPLLRNFKYLYLYISLWVIVAVIQFLVLYLDQGLAWHRSLLDSATFNLLFAALGLSFWYTCRYIALEKVNLQKILLHHSTASIVVTFIWIGVSYFMLVQIISVDAIYRNFLQSSLTWRIPIGILFYFVTITFYYVHIYATNLQEHRLKEAELRALVKEAELKSLKFQINPHFIFNSLNSINSLIISDPKKAGEMTAKLGDFLRYTLSKNEQQKSTFKEELDSARLYLDIEKIRFGDKFDFEEQIQKECLNVLVPNMLLQPLFENAIKHGVYESIDKIKIKLSCSVNGNFMTFSLENDFDPEGLSKKGEGIGLKNIENRLELLYKQKSLLHIQKGSRQFKVTIFIPIHTR
ncbi:MAG: sensor histidine kinase [bacterium]